MLKKILEEMKKIKDGNRKENLYAKYPPKDEKGKILNGYSQGYEDGTDNFYNAMVDIIRKHMKDDKCGECSRRKWYQKGYEDGKKDNDGWIPCDERLPEVDADIDESWEDDDCHEYNVTIQGASEATTLKYSPDGDWFDANGCVYNVIAWQPLPEPYRPEKGAEG